MYWTGHWRTVTGTQTHWLSVTDSVPRHSRPTVAVHCGSLCSRLHEVQRSRMKAAKRRRTSHTPPWRADLNEWLGDALLGDYVARILHHVMQESVAPPLERTLPLVRALHDLTVSNRNLESVYDENWPGSSRPAAFSPHLPSRSHVIHLFCACLGHVQ